MAPTFKSTVRLIQDGQPVDANHTNAPVNDLTQRTDYLKAILDALEAGQLLAIVNAPLESGMLVGTPVYLDSDGIYKPALQALAEDAAGGLAATSAYVFGVIVGKDTATSGTIGTLGRVTTLDLTDWADVIDGGVATPGHYFLSAENTGRLSSSRGPLSVYVGQLLPDGTFMAKPVPPVEGAHVHYTFELVGAPAGTVVDPVEPAVHVVTTPDTDARGWLPAEAPYFATEQIPEGAKFGYNLAHEDEAPLLAVFPPIPLSGAFFAQGGGYLDSDKIVVNDFGIWWMDDSFGNAPWPVDFAESETADPVHAWFSRLLAATAGGIVTRLENDPASVLDIQIVDLAGVAASQGRLRLRVDQILTAGAVDDESGFAIKSVDGGTSSSGPVIARIKAGAGISASGTEGDATDGWHGAVTLSVSGSDSLQGDAEIVNLRQAQEDFVNDIPMVTLPNGRDCSPVFSFQISRLAPAVSKLRVRPWLYSSLSGAIPAGFDVQYRIVPAASSNTVLPTGWASLTTIVGQTLVGGQAKQFDMAPDIAAVPAGAIVLIKVIRVGTSDGFTGKIGLLRLGYQLI